MPTRNLERYRTDPDYRKRCIIHVTAYIKRKLASDPLYRRYFHFKNKLSKRKKRPPKTARIPIEEYEAHLAELKALRVIRADPHESAEIMRTCWKQVRAKYLGKVKPKPASTPRPKRQPIDPEVRRRNLLNHEANLQRQRAKAQATKEWKELTAAWRAKWWPILGRCSARKKACRTRREYRIRSSRLPRDNALAHQLAVIKAGPCICFWCDKPLPSGGQVDHIRALSKGGTHSSDNICAACVDCNSIKNDRAPNDTTLQPILL